MLTRDCSTVRRWIPTYLDRCDVEAALDDVYLRYDDLYNGITKYRWQIEREGCFAQQIKEKLENAPGFYNVEADQQWNDNQPLTLVTFTYERPDEFDPFYLVDISED